MKKRAYLLGLVLFLFVFPNIASSAGKSDCVKQKLERKHPESNFHNLIDITNFYTLQMDLDDVHG